MNAFNQELAPTHGPALATEELPRPTDAPDIGNFEGLSLGDGCTVLVRPERREEIAERAFALRALLDDEGGVPEYPSFTEASRHRVVASYAGRLGISD